jgi:hypothetical protein
MGLRNREVNAEMDSRVTTPGNVTIFRHEPEGFPE